MCCEHTSEGSTQVEDHGRLVVQVTKWFFSVIDSEQHRLPRVFIFVIHVRICLFPSPLQAVLAYLRGLIQEAEDWENEGKEMLSQPCSQYLCIWVVCLIDVLFAFLWDLLRFHLFASMKQ